MGNIHLPALCENCGYAFPSRMIGLAEGAELTSFGNVDTCPKCKHSARIADGIFSNLDGVLKVFSSPDVSQEQLNNIIVALKQAADNNETGNELADRIDKIEPDLGDFVRQNSPSFPLKTLVVILMLMIKECSVNIDVNIDVDLNELVEQFSEQTTPPLRSRNSLCECGSGERYKHCHGKL